MSDIVSPDRIKAFLDDLARLSLRHGVVVGSVQSFFIEPRSDEFGGYCEKNYPVGGGGGGVLLSHPEARLIGVFRPGMFENSGADVEERSQWVQHSIDITQLSNHERLKIIGGKS